MADTLTPEKRSWLMSRVRGRDTKPELAVRQTAHAMGLRFRLHRRDLPGRPDLVFPRHRLAIFVHGCFWHRHEGCAKASTPKTRPQFWDAKFAANLRRDREVERQLIEGGWRVGTIWECETKDRRDLEATIAALLVHR
ncbi:very short patch repair endonuclease [uncultured Sphingomonas sp.]|uniref:very short patch repair endonuclease n=1 Tax=uncultured Sphingomonas sp. TaxID=158754 RepID=UPI0025DD9AFE|nr:very short patch repair endonuclease [uncultured Sphingomonas sp.]